ncbi:hypothetical protein [Sneathiella chinensis]|uniref:Uncharacterized protein n=1 Tax=Sneathiella chinensis TaxID=349750 RepID=A0ABQ5U1F7_9PROT|nr:hypothetical protein [Sneathiella chinensis]GLQ06017.1 hypothetical protein GCM10007924_12380 [Sneathiella chinensis]
MFSRNEKYGQALHLPYGFDIPASKSVKGTDGLFAKIRSFFTAGMNVNHVADLTPVVEVDLDRNVIEQAILTELRNTESAANENRLQGIKGRTA